MHLPVDPTQVGLLDFPLTLALLIIGLAGPVLAALGFALSALHRLHLAISAFFVRQQQKQIAARALLEFRGDEAYGTQKKTHFTNKEIVDTAQAQKSCFYLVDLQIGNPEVQQSVQVLTQNFVFFGIVKRGSSFSVNV